MAPLPQAARRRLDDLGARYALAESAQAALAAFLQLIASDPTPPTAVRDPVAAVDVHVADALVALEVPEIRAAASVADLGSGAGIPGLVLAMALPAARVSLVESNRRKSSFIGRAIEVSGVHNALVVNDRAETWAAGKVSQDVVTARALAPLNVVAEYAAPLLRVGGTLVVWTGKREPEVEASAAQAGKILGLSGPLVFEVTPFAASEHRHLHIMSKVSDTPATFPRRPGVARKRPLGLAGTTV